MRHLAVGFKADAVVRFVVKTSNFFGCSDYSEPSEPVSVVQVRGNTFFFLFSFFFLPLLSKDIAPLVIQLLFSPFFFLSFAEQFIPSFKTLAEMQLAQGKEEEEDLRQHCPLFMAGFCFRCVTSFWKESVRLLRRCLLIPKKEVYFLSF
jgi:hypothetical protein